MLTFAPAAATVGFPFVAQAARLTRCVDSEAQPAQGLDREYLLTSRPAAELPPQPLLDADRAYWGIETGLHLRLDVSAGEDRSRVRTRTAALNLAMMRRVVVSLAVHWMRHCRNRRQATLTGFYDFMSANRSKKAFSLVTVCRSSWLPKI